VEVHFHGGAVRSYLIVHQTAGYGRTGGWSVRSFAESGVQGSLDLRRPEHVAKLTRFLETAALPGGVK
jgi:hypothetical protein